MTWSEAKTLPEPNGTGSIFQLKLKVIKQKIFQCKSKQ